MNNRLKNSIEILQRAYLEETLIAGDCQACAVGNLVAKSGYKGKPYDWRFIFVTSKGEQHFFSLGEVSPADMFRGYKAIKATGYSVRELARIEYTFETALISEEAEELPVHEVQWIRLQAVLKVLFDIEGISYDQEVEKPFLEKALA